MTSKQIRSRTLIAIIACTASLGGCLSDSSPIADSDFTGGGNGTSNSPPIISGNPQTAVVMGDGYSFTPTAGDADGDTLTFSVSNMPDWASFDASTGTVSGQPSLADVGTYTNIGISVTDGTDSTSMPDFDITVSQVALGSMTLTWTPPTENTDGTTLSDLAGYRIYYGLSEGNYPNRVNIDAAGLSSYVVENLLPNTYYVVATSVNSIGVESRYSNVAIKTVEGS